MLQNTSDHLAVQYEKEQRVAHPDYLKKYIQQQVPARIISDEHIIAMVETLNNPADTDQSKERIIHAFAAYHRDGLLYDFVQKLIMFAEKLNNSGDDALLKGIYEYSDRFSLEPMGLLDSEMDRARALVYAIANKYRASQKIQQVLQDAISMPKSMYFASSVIILCTPNHNRIIENFENIDLAGLKQVYKERFKKEYVEPKKDIFPTAPSSVRYLIYPIEDPDLVTSYMLSLFRERSSRIGKLLLLYAADRHLGSDRSRWRFQYEDLKTKFGIEKLYEYVKEHRDEAYENDDEKWAVKQFLKIHEEQARMPRV
jgi:hypothetical protein